MFQSFTEILGRPYTNQECIIKIDTLVINICSFLKQCALSFLPSLCNRNGIMSGELENGIKCHC